MPINARESKTKSSKLSKLSKLTMLNEQKVEDAQDKYFWAKKEKKDTILAKRPEKEQAREAWQHRKEGRKLLKGWRIGEKISKAMGKTFSDKRGSKPPTEHDFRRMLTLALSKNHKDKHVGRHLTPEEQVIEEQEDEDFWEGLILQKMREDADGWLEEYLNGWA
jgi:hypothetical protein